MLVRELIGVLAELPGDLRVVVDGYECGLDDPHVKWARAHLSEALPSERAGWWDGVYVEICTGEADPWESDDGTLVVAVSRGSAGQWMIRPTLEGEHDGT